MSDQITGTAVLVTGGNPHRLWVMCSRENGATRSEFTECIPVYEEGSPKTEDPMWQYRRLEGGELEVTPSLHLMVGQPGDRRTIFHNGGRWRVRYVEVKNDDSEANYQEFKRLNSPAEPHPRD